MPSDAGEVAGGLGHPGGRPDLPLPPGEVDVLHGCEVVVGLGRDVVVLKGVVEGHVAEDVPNGEAEEVLLDHPCPSPPQST